MHVCIYIYIHIYVQYTFRFVQCWLSRQPSSNIFYLHSFAPFYKERQQKTQPIHFLPSSCAIYAEKYCLYIPNICIHMYIYHLENIEPAMLASQKMLRTEDTYIKYFLICILVHTYVYIYIYICISVQIQICTMLASKATGFKYILSALFCTFL